MAIFVSANRKHVLIIRRRGSVAFGRTVPRRALEEQRQGDTRARVPWRSRAGVPCSRYLISFQGLPEPVLGAWLRVYHFAS